MNHPIVRICALILVCVEISAKSVAYKLSARHSLNKTSNWKSLPPVSLELPDADADFHFAVYTT